MVYMRMKSFFWIVLVMSHALPASVFLGYSQCLLPHIRRPNEKFQQRAERFWGFDEQSNSWVEINLPYDLVSCSNGSCTKVASIGTTGEQNRSSSAQENEKVTLQNEALMGEESSDPILPERRGVSLTRVSEASIWVTGQSGSIYERFWNGVRWVIAPHELPSTAGCAISVFIVNHTIFSLSELGKLYKLQLNENTHPVWIESTPVLKAVNSGLITKQSSTEFIKSAVASNNGEMLHFSTLNGLLLELSDVQTMRCSVLGRPPGGDVISIIDATSVRPGVIFTLSSAGELYVFNKYTRPTWKKHIWREASAGVLLTPSTGCILEGLTEEHSLSLFLLNKGGLLVERCLHHQKWRWIAHGAPKGQSLTAITGGGQTKSEGNISSLYLTTETGHVFEYQLTKHPAGMQGKHERGKWIDHIHPRHAKVERGTPGLHLHLGRMLFPLEDGRLGELHQQNIGGEHSGPNHQVNPRRKASHKYEWSILEVPETEGWNAEYCSDELGPTNCITGTIANGPHEEGTVTTNGRKPDECQQYPSMGTQDRHILESGQDNLLTESIFFNFRLRAMNAERSFFIISKEGSAFEYLYAENMILWLRHEYLAPIKGALGTYNGSLFMVDADGNLLIRERIGSELTWINCTAMKKGRQVATGPPWDSVHGRAPKLTAEDALFFISKTGRLLQFIVSLRKFKWKDCHHPPNTKIAYIVDQEVLRMNVVFIVGRDGRLYHYNRLTELWHQHCQSYHLLLKMSPGTVLRTSPLSLTSSLFMLLENGDLVEYHWDSRHSPHGWNWIEHGTPYRNVKLVSAPGPSFGGSQLFLVGSDGHVYRRYMDQNSWKWENHGSPYKPKKATADPSSMMCPADGERTEGISSSCNEKVAAVRPIKFSEDAVIFELQDGRLAELRKSPGGSKWEWARIIDTPISSCAAGYWTALAS